MNEDVMIFVFFLLVSYQKNKIVTCKLLLIEETTKVEDRSKCVSIIKMWRQINFEMK